MVFYTELFFSLSTISGTVHSPSFVFTWRTVTRCVKGNGIAATGDIDRLIIMVRDEFGNVHERMHIDIIAQDDNKSNQHCDEKDLRLATVKYKRNAQTITVHTDLASSAYSL